MTVDIISPYVCLRHFHTIKQNPVEVADKSFGIIEKLKVAASTST